MSARRERAVGARLWRLPSRGVITVRGEDRLRWLDGMLTCNVKRLAPGDGAHGLLLTPQGRIAGELHVLQREGELWLETEASAIAGTLARLAKYVIADDVVLADATPDWARLALEGEGALATFAACGSAAPASAHGVAASSIAGAAVVAARYGFTCAEALQLFVGRESEDAVFAALVSVGAESASAEELELRRIEAGTPWLGKELDESVLPAEARLDGVAVALDKGCYTGQEVVARMRSRGRLSHLLVGLRFAGGALPAPHSPLASERGEAGSVTSAMRSPRFGAIGLGFVQAPLAEPGTKLRAGDVVVEVAALPFA
ncbi:MAG TPA: glycine cleavage T C-terminal barrel domain-containing protein [Myxococcota bacterium]|nr:glycine cleavage T C-terminal barrel domain-containing protein [Myxococcota bacterium]